jgi:hypothetical protein
MAEFLLDTSKPRPVRAPVTAALIVKDDPHLLDTLACLGPYVSEIVVVYTGPERKREHEVMSLAHIYPSTQTEGTNRGVAPDLVKIVYDHYPDCIDENGKFSNFAKARQRSFDLATEPWILWADSDDEIVGLETLAGLMEQAKTAREMAAREHHRLRICAFYEKAFDARGACTYRTVIERIIPNGPEDRGQWHWIRPVHERLEARDVLAQVDVFIDSIIWKHRPHESRDERAHRERNFYILERYEREQEAAHVVDRQTFYDLGLEYQMANYLDTKTQVEKAVHYFKKYFEAAQTPEEKGNAALRASEMFWKVEVRDVQTQYPVNTLHWATQACEHGKRFEDYYAVAKLFWILGIVCRDGDLFGRAIQWATKALDAPTVGRFDSNPQDRAFGVHELLADCHAQRGDWEKAAHEADGVLTILHETTGPNACLIQDPGFQKWIGLRDDYHNRFNKQAVTIKYGEPVLTLQRSR